jgi:sigma-E factor negative regulatory protein RseC
VTLQMRDGASLRSAMTSYGLGAVLMILGASGGQLVASAAEADVWAVAGAAGGLVAAFIINRILHRSRRWRGSLHVEMSRPGAVCAHDFGGLR